MKNVLVLSCSTGGGHNSVASAICELFSMESVQCHAYDALSFISKQWPEIAADVHSYVYRHRPILFDKTYQYAEHHRQELRGDNPIRKLLDRGSNKLARYIVDNQITHVICTHPFAGLMLTDAINKKRLSLDGTGIIETDYAVSPGSEYSLLDHHFVPDAHVKKMLLNLGVPEEKIVVSGIPIRKQFYSFMETTVAKQHLGVDPEKKHIVIASGSMGCGPIEDILRNFMDMNTEHLELTVACGSNKKLYQQLVEKYNTQECLHILPNVDNMSELLDSADIYMTKPGGISITEAAFKKVPMILINEVGGCEQHNLEHFVEAGAAKTASTVSGLCEKTIEALMNPLILKEMKNAETALMFEHDVKRISQAFA